MDIEVETPTAGEEIYIPQHAGGRDKSIALLDENQQHCTILKSADHKCNAACTCFANYEGEPDVQYTCDTEAGSSGAPVISADTHRVIAHHHCGGDCNRGGNHGVPMSEIYHDVAEFVYPCVDDPNFTHLVGYKGTSCDWFAGNPESRCRMWGDGSWQDTRGNTARESCCVCIDYYSDYTSFPTTEPTPDPTPKPTPGPTRGDVSCTDNPDFTNVEGYNYANCDWFAENPSSNCESFGGESWKDVDGHYANEVCRILYYHWIGCCFVGVCVYFCFPLIFRLSFLFFPYLRPFFLLILVRHAAPVEEGVSMTQNLILYRGSQLQHVTGLRKTSNLDVANLVIGLV